MKMYILHSDIDIAARTVYGEARGESYKGKLAVAAVMVNRWKAKFRGATTLAAVCQHPYQFSCWNTNDPNCKIVFEVDERDPIFRESQMAVLDALNPKFIDPTKGSLHYHTVAMGIPKWAEGKEPTVIIDSHKFYTGIK